MLQVLPRSGRPGCPLKSPRVRPVAWEHSPGRMRHWWLERGAGRRAPSSLRKCCILEEGVRTKRELSMCHFRTDWGAQRSGAGRSLPPVSLRGKHPALVTDCDVDVAADGAGPLSARPRRSTLTLALVRRFPTALGHGTGRSAGLLTEGPGWSLHPSAQRVHAHLLVPSPSPAVNTEYFTEEAMLPPELIL